MDRATFYAGAAALTVMELLAAVGSAFMAWVDRTERAYATQRKRTA